jgi:hypothetical protein
MSSGTSLYNQMDKSLRTRSKNCNPSFPKIAGKEIWAGLYARKEELILIDVLLVG